MFAPHNLWGGSPLPRSQRTSLAARLARSAPCSQRALLAAHPLLAAHLARSSPRSQHASLAAHPRLAAHLARSAPRSQRTRASQRTSLAAHLACSALAPRSGFLLSCLTAITQNSTNSAPTRVPLVRYGGAASELRVLDGLPAPAGLFRRVCRPVLSSLLSHRDDTKLNRISSHAPTVSEVRGGRV